MNLFKMIEQWVVHVPCLSIKSRYHVLMLFRGAKTRLLTGTHAETSRVVDKCSD